MTLEFKILEDYKREGQEKAERIGKYSEASLAAKSKLIELTTQYEVVFTESMKSGKDSSVELTEIDRQIAETKEKVELLSRDERLAHAAMPKSNISPVDVVEDFKVYTEKVRALHIPNIEARLKLARDLIVSVLQDGRELEGEYNGVTEEVQEISKANHKNGRTPYWNHVGHPISEATILRNSGPTNAVRGVLEDVSKYTYGTTPYDFEYIAEAPTTKGETK